MSPIKLNLSDNDRQKFEKLKRKHSPLPYSPSHKRKEVECVEPAQTQPPIQPEETEAVIITEKQVLELTLNILLEGMTEKGNQIDKKAAESLLQSIRYKMPQDFYEQCMEKYQEALKKHENFLGFLRQTAKQITQNITQMIDESKTTIKNITQKILWPNDKAIEI